MKTPTYTQINRKRLHYTLLAKGVYTMSKRLKRHAHTLKYLGKCDKNTARAIIGSASKDLLHCFSDICHNILKGNVNLSKAERQKLIRHKNTIRKIADTKTTAKNKKKLIQKGGFLGTLLAPLIRMVIGPLAKSILG